MLLGLRHTRPFFVLVCEWVIGLLGAPVRPMEHAAASTTSRRLLLLGSNGPGIVCVASNVCESST